MASRRRKTGPKTPSYSEEETREALLAFNAAVARQDEERRESKRKAKADRVRKEAAEAVKRVNADPSSSPEDRAAAEQAYREAVEAWGRIDRGEPEPVEEPSEEAAGDEAAADANTDEAGADDAAGDEAAGDEAGGEDAQVTSE